MQLWDEVVDDTILMCVDTYTETMTCISPKIYRYEIQLMSEAKQLEGVVLPNLKITKMPDITRSIYDYIKQYIDEYAPKIRTNTSSPYRWENKWKISGEVQSRFENIECPEMQWNTPTLREVLNDLMMVDDCIPTLRNGTLYLMDLTTINKDNEDNIIDWSKTPYANYVNYVTRSKSAEDYVSELQCKLENVTNKSEEVNNVVTMTEYCHLSIPDNDATMTTKNITLKTKYPIYNLKSVKIMFPGTRSYTDGQGTQLMRIWDSADLLALPRHDSGTFSIISEYQEWITKKIRYNAAGPTNFEDWANYQNFSLYYQRGSNEITNFSQVGKVNWFVIFGVNWILWELLTVRIMYENDTFGTDATPKWYNLLFTVEYETLEGCLFRASKNDDVEHERVVIDNQTNSMVDSYTQGFMEYQKANRLGNEQLQINVRIPWPPIGIRFMQIGDMFDDCVIYQCQYQFFKTHVEINALATKNYILREYFTGVKSKIRSWVIASGAEALTRHDLIKYYCEFSWRLHKERNTYYEGDDFTMGLGELSLNNVGLYLLSPLTIYSAQPIKTCFIRTTDDSDDYHPAIYPDENNVKSYYLIDLMSRVVGNSIVFTFGFLDNYWAGQSFHTQNDFNGETPDSDDKYIKSTDIQVVDNVLGVSTNDLVSATGGVPMYQHSYTDDKGENVGGEVIFGCGVHNAVGYSEVQPGDNWWLSNNTLAATKSFVWFIYQRPRVFEYNIKYNDDYDYEEFRVPFYFHKDSQEITNLSTQLEFCTDTPDICFGKEWIRRQKAVSITNNTTIGYKLYRFDVKRYNFRNPDDLPTGALDTINVKLGYRQLVDDDSNLNIRAVLALDYAALDSASEQEATEKGQGFADDSCFYLTDASDKVLLAFRNVPMANIGGGEINEGLWVPTYEIVLNILASRNKNIYDHNNPYLIVDKI